MIADGHRDVRSPAVLRQRRARIRNDVLAVVDTRADGHAPMGVEFVLDPELAAGDALRPRRCAVELGGDLRRGIDRHADRGSVLVHCHARRELTGAREVGAAVLVVGADPSFHRVRHLGQIDGRLHALGARRAAVRGHRIEGQTTGDRGQHRGAHTLRIGVFGFDVRARLVAVSAVDAAQILFLARVALMEIRHAELEVVAEPLIDVAADRERAHAGEIRDIFVGYDQIDRISAQRARLHQHLGIGRRRQRAVQQDAALHVVDVVVLRRHQLRDRQHQTGVSVAHLHPDLLGTHGDVLILQVIQRSAGAAKFLPRIERSGLRPERIDGALFFAE